MLRRFIILPLILTFAASADARCRRPAPDAGDSLAYTAPALSPRPSPLPQAETFPAPGPKDEQASDVLPPKTQNHSGPAGKKQEQAVSDAPKPAASVKTEGKAPELQAPTSEPSPAEVGAAPTLFTVLSGETLRTALTRWTSGSGWQLVWEAPHDYTISAPAEFHGGVRQAVTQLMESLRANGAPFGADVWEGNHVIRITRFR